ncbi:DNA adenine methylase [Methylocella tundrae]|uniref:site-specific DNA-methyltransferase (adenine-specific) n=1 Tax=Methylocella tundrae TaxID=227605 RepID=A0A4U8YZY5_METTU|nr:DNA adenine methylase [Methylocella tundrae]WPP04796.1 DNA adenine methylase [Methylocella tundrae]VFU07024.1 DNA methyltransferase [Methylocella tundrae]
MPNCSDFRRVDPVRPAAAYIGGKKQLAAAIVARIEAAPHRTYAEPFVGMGGVFLRRRFAPPSEVINDLSGDVATFFRILQRHYVAFMDMLKFQLTSRREFDRLVATDPATLTDLERAARFLYLQRTAFGGKVAGRNFGVSPGLPGRFDVTKLAEILTALSERLAGVVIENLAYGEFIDRYDQAGTLFYLDPPYLGTEHFYGAGAFTRADFGRLAKQLEAIAGAFILTVNDLPETRSIFSAFDQEQIGVTYTAAEGDAKRASELIVSRVATRKQATFSFD